MTVVWGYYPSWQWPVGGLHLWQVASPPGGSVLYIPNSGSGNKLPVTLRGPQFTELLASGSSGGQPDAQIRLLGPRVWLWSLWKDWTYNTSVPTVWLTHPNTHSHTYEHLHISPYKCRLSEADWCIISCNTYFLSLQCLELLWPTCNMINEI